MTFDEFKPIAMILKTVYQRDNFLNSPEALKIWFQVLGDLSAESLTVAVRKYIETKPFPPAPADLRQIATEITTDTPSDWGHGWEQVRNAIRRHGVYDTKGALDSMDEVTRATVMRMGWQEICLSENIEIDRANFRMIYEQLAKRESERLQLSPGLQKALTDLQEQLTLTEKKMLEGENDTD